MLEQECSRFVYCFFWGGRGDSLRDQCSSHFNTLGFGHSFFPLRDSRGKRVRGRNLTPTSFPGLFSFLKFGLKRENILGTMLT